MFSESTNEELLATIETADNYYRNGDTRLFDLIDENAKVFVVNATEPFLCRDAFREHFEPNFAGQGRQWDVLQRDLQMLSIESAVLTKALRITQDEIPTILRQSAIWGRSEEGWKIKHSLEGFVAKTG